jgi:transposase-like protein
MDDTVKTKADWEAIEKKYRPNILSLREIARQHGVTEAAIRKKAKQLGWVRDLGAKVREKVRLELVRTEVRTPNAQDAVRTEREIIDSAAATVVQVVRSHRRDIAAGRDLVSLLATQLRDVAGHRDAFLAAIEAECAEDESGERRNKLMKAVSIPVHASTIRDLSTAMKNLIGLERTAFSIGDAPSETPQEPASAGQVAAGFDDLRAAFAKRLGKTDDDAPATP